MVSRRYLGKQYDLVPSFHCCNVLPVMCVNGCIPICSSLLVTPWQHRRHSRVDEQKGTGKRIGNSSGGKVWSGVEWRRDEVRRQLRVSYKDPKVRAEFVNQLSYLRRIDISVHVVLENFTCFGLISLCKYVNSALVFCENIIISLR